MSYDVAKVFYFSTLYDISRLYWAFNTSQNFFIGNSVSPSETEEYEIIELQVTGISFQYNTNMIGRNTSTVLLVGKHWIIEQRQQLHKCISTFQRIRYQQEGLCGINPLKEQFFPYRSLAKEWLAVLLGYSPIELVSESGFDYVYG